MYIRALLPIAIGLVRSSALDNGFDLPALGYSTWNDCSSFRDNGPQGWCWDSEAHVRNITLYMKSSGLLALGYNRVNIDEGWLVGRDNATGTMIDDLSKFPSGMKGLGDWVKAQGFHYGLYSCRGVVQCSTGTYHAVGSHGFELQDVDWMVAQGADYLKIDSCGASQDHATAFSDYGKFRDAMNASGKRVWFSVCGWEEWYSPPDPAVGYGGGSTLGNSWRIAGDGSGWGPLSNCINQQAASAVYAGPGSWPDPDLLIGPKVYVGGQTDEQARAQFTLWSIFPTNLLISQNMLQWSDYALETYSNAELIAINQDSLMSPARRISGKDLALPCSPDNPATKGSVSTETVCNSSDPTFQWAYDPNSQALSNAAFPGSVLVDLKCVSGTDGAGVGLWDVGTPFPCGQGSDAGKWVHTDGRFINAASGNCLDVYNWRGPTVDTWQCNGGSNQNFTFKNGGLLFTVGDAQPMHYPACLVATTDAVGDCTNVWGRKLSDGYALAFVNNADSNVTVTCDASCFASLNISSSVTSLKVRDLWAHVDIGTITAPFSFSAAVGHTGSASAYKLTPA